MNILLLNGSPRAEKSSTASLLEALAQGMVETDEKVNTEMIHLYRHKIHPCSGCYSCWTKTPGKCIFSDDMPELLAKYRMADIIVYGTPLYHFTMSGTMKVFIDRTLPINEPWLIPHPTLPGRTGHPTRDHKKQKVLLVSPCGFPEIENFDSLVHTFRHYAKICNNDYLGEILCTSAEMLSREGGRKMSAPYLEVVKKVGKEILEKGCISKEYQEILDKGLFQVDKETFYQLANGYWNMRMEGEYE